MFFASSSIPWQTRVIYMHFEVLFYVIKPSFLYTFVGGGEPFPGRLYNWSWRLSSYVFDEPAKSRNID